MSARTQSLLICTVVCLLSMAFVGLAGAQNSRPPPSVSVVASFGDQSPCYYPSQPEANWIHFDGSGSKDANGRWVSFVWFVHGAKDPHGFGNSSSYRFQLGGAGSFVVALEVSSPDGVSARKEISFQAIECSGTPTASPSPTARPAYAHIWVKKVCLEDAPMSGEHSQGPNGEPIVSWSWSIRSPSGAIVHLDGRTVTFVGREEGIHKIFLQVKDERGNVGSVSREDYHFYRCVPQGTASPSPGPCQEYRDESGAVHSKCEPYPAPTAPGGADSARCHELRRNAESFRADYAYRYEKYRSERDEAALRELEAEKQRFMSEWERHWREAQCAYASGNDSYCSNVAQQHAATIQELQARLRAAWESHQKALAEARQQFASSGYHSESEWRSFEEKWQRLTFEVQARMQAEMEAIASRYPELARCGFHGAPMGPPVTDYKAMYGSPPVAATPYAMARSQCEERMIQIKDEYASRFESLYRRLMSLPQGSPDHDALRREISSLEAEVQAKMQALMAECRNDYRSQYEAPENYRDGAGELRCFFDESSKAIRCSGKYVSFQGDPQTQILSRFSCGGQLFFDQMYSNAAFEDFTFETAGGDGALRIRSANLKMILHDSPRGVVNAGVVGGAELYFVPAVHLSVEVAGNKVRLTGVDSSGVWMGSEGAFAWDPAKRLLTLRGEATWVSESCLPDGSRPDGASDGKYWDAIERRKLGAQVVVRLADGKVGQANETYDDQMRVEVSRERANKYQAIVNAEHGTCKTVVLKFDAAIFASIDLKVSITDASGELAVQEASSLEDVLDPCDDGEDGFEYWIVVDKYGTQVLVSFAHFSEKRVSVEAAAVGNFGVPGFEAVVLVVAAVTAIGVARRRVP